MSFASPWVWTGTSSIWASFGEYDRSMLQRSCSELGVAYPFGPLHLNVKTLTSAVLGRPISFGMAGALKDLGLPLVGTHHRGADDAWNIAQILAHVLGGARRGIGTR
jgi:inhibitor of KinA sporulation pathway (predicted exonuclease)